MFEVLCVSFCVLQSKLSHNNYFFLLPFIQNKGFNSSNQLCGSFGLRSSRSAAQRHLLPKETSIYSHNKGGGGQQSQEVRYTRILELPELQREGRCRPRWSGPDGG